ncbi:MAG: phage portal protein, partial [Eubacterium sp.]
LEMEVKVTGSKMADFINEQFNTVRKDIRPNVEYACAGGGIVFKPYVNGDKIATEIIQANAFYPFAFNNAQKITGAYFIYRHWEGKKIYSRLEKHELKNNSYKLTNTAYVSMHDDSLGKECSLTEVYDWKDIQPEVLLNNIESPLFAYFKIPIGNTIDMRSPLGVSVYSRAIGLIKEADKQFQRLMWEYEGGELAIDVSEDIFPTVGGKPLLPEGKERLFRPNILDAVTANGSKLMNEWAPQLRDANYMSGLNRLLIQIEDACCLSRGTLSDPSEIAKSATEIKIMKQRSYALITDIQKSLELALNDLAYAMYCIALLYELCPDGEYSTSYIWDDSIIVDAESERIRDQQEVSQGLMLPYEYRMKWYGEDEATAKTKLGELEDETDDEILGFNKELENEKFEE